MDKPFIIPVFIPHAGCPHRCIFCNQNSVTGVTAPLPTPHELAKSIDEYLSYNRNCEREVQIAFFGGNFLGLSEHDVRYLLGEAEKRVKEGRVDGIRFSTRPDTVNAHMLDILEDYTVSTVEIGVQSMDGRVLKLSARGHSPEDSRDALLMLKERGFQVGVQVMVGLPGDCEAASIATCEKIADLSPDIARIYPTVVIEKSPLAKLWKAGKYAPMELDPCVTLVKNMFHIFQRNGVKVIRMGLQPTEDINDSRILAGPFHPSFGHLVYSEIFLDGILEKTREMNPENRTLIIRVHPRNISTVRGLKNGNIKKLMTFKKLQRVEVLPDDNLGAEDIRIEYQ